MPQLQGWCVWPQPKERVIQAIKGYNLILRGILPKTGSQASKEGLSVQAQICWVLQPIVLYLCFLLSTDVRAHGSWKLLEDPELQTLACKLPATILHSCADSTVINNCRPFEGGRFGATPKV